jgi:hypothetical protein
MSRSLRALCALLLLAAFPSCVHHNYHRGRPAPVVLSKPGPPPHAPAHGYRHKHHHHGVELVFDSQLGVYVVVGWEEHFFYKDHFYRLVNGRWELSARLDGGWGKVKSGKLPKGLAKKRAKGKHGKGKHRHPAKHGH